MKRNSFILRYARNKAAVIGGVYIVIISLVAILAYVLAPDDSVDANMQVPELRAKPPGHTQTFLYLPSNELIKNSVFFGTIDRGKWIPIKQYQFKKDSIRIERYVDEDTCVWETIGLSAALEDINRGQDTYIKQKTYWLGTDGLGRDMLSRLMVGARVSLEAGFIGVLVSLIIGFFLGAWAGFLGGKIDAFISWLMGVSWAIPTLLLAFAITLFMGKGSTQIMLAIGLSMWVNVARLVRGLIKSTKEMEYVQAARTIGFSNSRIILKHILPNIMSPLLVLSAGNFASAIMLEAGLSFLGLGVQPPTPSWGSMLREHYQFLLTQHPMPAIIPGLAIMLLVLSFNLMGNGLRDALDVRS